MHSESRSRASKWLIVAAILCCAIQLFWFSSKCFNQIDYDGMAYVGIARHLRQGEFHAAINAFRSPLLSWLIAAAALGSSDYLHIGKLINITAFLLSLSLLFFLRSGCGIRSWWLPWLFYCSHLVAVFRFPQCQ
jgi:hypothetical protein